ncbi:MAG: hypothetical protein L6R35_002177 [Caloplaca aegaea]|nr:MAG: hypothetical protein L6R35_002177 [Caloplaca aegaea]
MNRLSELAFLVENAGEQGRFDTTAFLRDDTQHGRLTPQYPLGRQVRSSPRTSLFLALVAFGLVASDAKVFWLAQMDDANDAGHSAVCSVE